VATTYDVDFGVEQTGAPSKRWYIVRLRKGIFPGRKVGRTWRLTESDIDAAIEILKSTNRTTDATRRGLTDHSRRRVGAK